MKKERDHGEIFGYIGYSLIFIVVFILIFCLSSYFVKADDKSNQYILSAIFQGLAAILALTITAVLVISQMVASTYSHRAIKYSFSRCGLYVLIAYYGILMIVSLLMLGYIKYNVLNPSSDSLPSWAIPLIISLTGGSIVAVGVFVEKSLNSLKPQVFFNVLKKETENIKHESELELDEKLQTFSDIIISSIYKYDVETARMGINALLELYLFFIEKGKKKIAKNILSHLNMYRIVAQKQELGVTLLEIVRVINKMILNEDMKEKSDLAEVYKLTEKILVYAKDNQPLIFKEILDEIKDTAIMLLPNNQNSQCVNNLVSLLDTMFDSFSLKDMNQKDKHQMLLYIMHHILLIINRAQESESSINLIRPSKRVMNYLLFVVPDFNDEFGWSIAEELNSYYLSYFLIQHSSEPPPESYEKPVIYKNFDSMGVLNKQTLDELIPIIEEFMEFRGE